MARRDDGTTRPCRLWRRSRTRINYLRVEPGHLVTAWEATNAYQLTKYSFQFRNFMKLMDITKIFLFRVRRGGFAKIK